MAVPNAPNGAGPSTTSSESASSCTPTSTTSGKPRSCAICASRKVRCDKQYPCSRCKRAGIPCVRPSIDPRPQWARRYVQQASNDGDPSPLSSSKATGQAGMALYKVLDRLKLLEGMVKDLGSELEQARAKSSETDSRAQQSPSATSPTQRSDTDTVTAQTGRIVLEDPDRVRYVSSNFWSRIDHELDGLKQDTRGNGDNESEAGIDGVQSRETPSTSAPEADRTPGDRYSFLLGHGPKTATYDASALMPMPSQIPYLLEVFAERVHFVIGIPHMLSLKKHLQQRRNLRVEEISPAQDALVFAVFYAAIASLDEEEVIASFNVAKSELSHKFRIGFEQAIAKADFLNNPSDTLIEALILFLALARRHESPKFVWMMTGLVVRMAHYLGLHHDGAGSKHFTPFQIEMRRRIWWALCALDMRVTEDQGTELAISRNSYTTKIPSNLNDIDLYAEMTDLPPSRREVTNVTFLLLCSETSKSMQEMMAAGGTVTLEEHEHHVQEVTRLFERDYFSLTSASDPAYKAAAGISRIIVSRMTLLAFPPILATSAETPLSLSIRTKLLVAAIEVAEHNHALNSHPSCQPWRWVYQTQQHWYAVVYLLIEICRRPWSPIVERAWMALQSRWLVPLRAGVDRNFSVWAPLRRLMGRARRWRESEVERLRNDPDDAMRLGREDLQNTPVPSSSTTFPAYFDPLMFEERWRSLVGLSNTADSSTARSSRSTAPMQQASDNVNGTHEAADITNEYDISQHIPNTQHPPTSTLNANASTSSPDWMGNAMDFTNLDAFLGFDADMEYLDVMDTGGDFGFDWESFFDSAKAM